MGKSNGLQTEKEAGMVMGTNGSSIVSKRSVERIYYDEPHFFRHFVMTIPRRAPLINRGYWLRMYAIEHTVLEFLKEDTGRPKLVINFGCGFDPLLFQLLAREPKLCENVKFIDIDHHKLMLEKWDAIQNSAELKSLIPDAVFADQGGPLIRGKQYVGIGCDLGDLVELEKILKSELDPSKFSILCTAEVSLTYMDVKAADALIAWAVKLSDDTQFGLLEQFFPDGPEHPFAKTMMAHFTKWRAPLQSIHVYPTLSQQEQRFINANWKQAHARSLWAAWSDHEFISSEKRVSLDSFEAFDEWEELALFASHYFLLRASTRALAPEEVSPRQTAIQANLTSQDYPLRLIPNFPINFKGQKRFGALFAMDGQIGFHAGLGQKARLASTDLYASSAISSITTKNIPPETITARMCHTITQLGNGRCLLVGGRTAPSRVLNDTWLMEGGNWHQSINLLTPCFRHSATAVIFPGGDEGVLIYGGKSSGGKVTGQFALWRKTDETESWTVLAAHGGPCPRFGAVLSSIDSGRGILFGGMSQDGVVLNDFWTWQLSMSDDGEVSLQLTDETLQIQKSLPQISVWLSRFGATVHQLENKLVVIGGISAGGCIPHEYEVITLDLAALKCGSINNTPLPFTVDTSPTHPRPLLVGHSSLPVGGGRILIIGGGAVCFAFGTFWNNGTWLLDGGLSGSDIEWRMIQPVSSSDAHTTLNIDPPLMAHSPTTTSCLKN
ncbi:leucine carboxyl methyltransferase 2 [Arthroderma uncinatum]|uniref:leucine carboxyl methyltransferase 2 n=1 Tax=Arthroderma uncinatum TaxID=74035 RepID=UPI00144A8FFD|nr:leucine carboxyl methyltransferase 2 [Arthroderma uncinatum]KAF3483174.1 leucine carboxyl methyltransferase 2 [Arthroderma uncinatum]